MTVYGYSGDVLAKRMHAGVYQAALSGDWFTAVSLVDAYPKRFFYSLRDLTAERTAAWPEGVAFPDLGRGPYAFETCEAVTLHHFVPGGVAPPIPRVRGAPILGVFSPNQRYAAVAHRADRAGARTGVAIYDAAFTAEVAFAAGSAPTELTFTADSETLIALEEDSVRFIEVATGKTLGVLGPVR